MMAQASALTDSEMSARPCVSMSTLWTSFPEVADFGLKLGELHSQRAHRGSSSRAIIQRKKCPKAPTTAPAIKAIPIPNQIIALVP
jgi:hypothetical protein